MESSSHEEEDGKAHVSITQCFTIDIRVNMRIHSVKIETNIENAIRDKRFRHS